MSETSKIRPILNENVQALSPRQLRFMGAYLEQTTMEAAAKLTKVPKSTAYLWMQQAAFQAELGRQKERLFKEAMDFLLRSLKRAALTYQNLLSSESENVRARVAEGVIDRVLKLREQQDIVERLERLEKIIDSRR